MEKNEQQDPDYHHGYSSGMDRANPEIYEGYLSSVVSYDRLRHLITDYREELKDADQDFRQTREEQLQTYGALQQHVGKLDAIQKEVGRQDRQVQETEAEIEELEDRYRKAAPQILPFCRVAVLRGGAFVCGR
jgi:peptidoglycan hydrolase CwlO-like protein